MGVGWGGGGGSFPLSLSRLYIDSFGRFSQLVCLLMGGCLPMGCLVIFSWNIKYPDVKPKRIPAYTNPLYFPIILCIPLTVLLHATKEAS